MSKPEKFEAEPGGEREPKIRPFVAKMPIPYSDESLFGFFDRALQLTMIRNVRHGLALADVFPDRQSAPNSSKFDERERERIAALFKLDLLEVTKRCYPREHARSGNIEFFSTSLRAQYWEYHVRRVSPRALAVAPYHRAIWELRPFNFDAETQELLLDSCPVCRHRLGWISARGPTKCDACVDGDGRALTDLREFPQPLVEIADGEAVRFAVELVHPDPVRRSHARRLLPDRLSEVSNSELFEALITIASALRLEVAHKRQHAGRPYRARDFNIDANMLGMAAGALIGGEQGFGVVADVMRGRMSARDLSHGVSKELGPLAGMACDPQLSAPIRSFVQDAIARDLARTSDDGYVRRVVRLVPDDGIWCSLQQLSSELGITWEPLRRLVDSNAIEVKHAGAARSPNLVRKADVAPLVAIYKDAANPKEAGGALRVSARELEVLADNKVIVRVDSPVASMFKRAPH